LGIERYGEEKLIVGSLAYWSDLHEATAPQDNYLVIPIKEHPAVSMGRLRACFMAATKRPIKTLVGVKGGL
jgi:hypothetical protein